MTARLWQEKFGSWEVPCCPVHSHLVAEHGPKSLYPILSDITVFPSISIGARSKQYYVTGCPCTMPLKGLSYPSHAEAAGAWKKVATELNESRKPVSITA